MEWLSTKIDSFGSWVMGLFSAAFGALSTWFWDKLDGAISYITGWISFLVSAIELPEIFQTPPVAYIPPSICFLLSQTGFNDAMKILLAGLTFRLIRKIMTLGQW